MNTRSLTCLCHSSEVHFATTLVSFLLISLTMGCRGGFGSFAGLGQSKESGEPAFVPASATIPAGPRAVLFDDLPELQVGTGPADGTSLPEFSKTESGLSYRILRSSDRPKPNALDTVTVHYRGWLDRGKVFDSSYERGTPTTFALSNVIPAWTEGMQLVGEGGMIELWVPSRLGYGERGSPGSIPAHANLHFVVELIDIQ